MNEVWILSAVRTPVGEFDGSLSRMSTTRLGSVAIGAAVDRSGVKAAEVDESLMGCVLPVGLGPVPARAASTGAGLAGDVKTALVSAGWGSGLAAVVYGARSIASGASRVVVAGGMECMSGAPYLLRKARFGLKLGGGEFIDPILSDCLRDGATGRHSGEAAEDVAGRFAIDRSDQDGFALASYSRAIKAQKAGVFEDEIIPMTIPAGRDRFVSLEQDEWPQRHDPERFRSLEPLFREGGTVTSGNAAALADGAAAVMLASGEIVSALGLKPLARVASYAFHGGGAEELEMLSAAGAVKRLLTVYGLGAGDIDLYEINEDYAATTLAMVEELGVDPGKVNVNGGAIALGSPAGAAGARILTTLVHAMVRRDAGTGVAAVSSGGGEGVAIFVERV